MPSILKILEGCWWDVLCEVSQQPPAAEKQAEEGPVWVGASCHKAPPVLGVSAHRPRAALSVPWEGTGCSPERRPLAGEGGTAVSQEGITVWEGQGGGFLLGAPVTTLLSACPSCLGDPTGTGRLRNSKKKMLEPKKWQSLEETGSDDPQPRRHPSLCRSKTYDLCFSKEPEQEPPPARQRAASSSLAKRLASYHKAFKEIPEEETLLDSVSCAWQREVPYRGRLYISPNYVSFHCSLLLREVKVVLPVSCIAALKKANTALLVPNALSIRTTEGEKFLFVSLRSREATYKLLRSVCKHLQDGSTSSSLPASPANAICDQLCEKALTSSQSDLEQNCTEADSLQPQPDGLGPTRSRKDGGPEMTAPSMSEGGAPPGRKTKKPRGWALHLSTLNVVILIYLLLVLLLLVSSGYIGLRIVALEQQLMSMGAWPELDRQHHYKTT
ncbi:GRAM domain-containing protein 2A-like [Carettochelys insculpta]|uniref:GRAM domain-containing protein 2A-like n=1 Tax=Carettochelys insculpta TaxID=44489 RepID=UPI003EBF2E4E